MGQGPGLGRHLDFRKSEMEILAVRRMGRISWRGSPSQPFVQERLCKVKFQLHTKDPKEEEERKTSKAATGAPRPDSCRPEPEH